MNDQPQEPVVDDPWGPASGTGSAFSDPNVIEAENNGIPEDVVNGEEQYLDDSAAAPAKSKPNIAILALAGLLIIGVIGGAGFVAKQKFSPDRPPRERMAVIDPQDLAPVTGPQGNVFDAPVAARPVDAASAPVNVFDGPGAAGLPATAGAAPVTVTVSRPDAPAPASADALSSGTQPPAKPAGVTVTVNVPPAEPSADSKAAALVAAAPEVKPAQPVATPAQRVQIERPAAEKPAAKVATSTSKPRHAARKPATRVASASKASKPAQRRHTRVAKRSKSAAVASSEPKETYLLPSGMKVQGIFPQSGSNVQAWVTDGNGRTEVVRTGDTLRSGAQVIQIVAEKGQVITTSGVITTRGIN